MAFDEAPLSFLPLDFAANDTYNRLPQVSAKPSFPEGSYSPSSLFDSDAHETLLLARHPFVNIYRVWDTESVFIVFLSTRRLSLSIISLVAALIMGPAALVFWGNAASWTGILYICGSIILFVVAVLNYVLCVRTSHFSARFHDALTAVALLGLVPASINRYPMLSECVAKFGDQCRLGYVDSYQIVVTLIPFVLLSSRFITTAPFIFVYFILFVACRSAASVRDTEKQFLLLLLLDGSITVVSLLGVWLFDLKWRQRFEVWTILRRRIVELDRRRAAVNCILHDLLPDNVLTTIRSSQPLIENSENCTIGVFKISDYGRWSWAVRPIACGNLLASLIAMFDIALQRFKVDKFRITGDEYIVSCGLRSSMPPADSACNVIKFALFQKSHSHSVQRALAVPPFFLVCGIGSGPICAGFGGLRSLSYEGCGDALSCAMELASAAPPHSIVIGGSTTDLVHGLFEVAAYPPLASEADSSSAACVVLDAVRGFAHFPVAVFSPRDSRLALEPCTHSMQQNTTSFSQSFDQELQQHHKGQGESMEAIIQQSLMRDGATVNGVQQPSPAAQALSPESVAKTETRLRYLRECAFPNVPAEDVFGAMQLSELERKLSEVASHWWNLGFDSPRIQDQFTEYRASSNSRSTRLSGAFMSVISVAFLIIVLVEASWTPVSLGLLLGACVGNCVRLWVISRVFPIVEAPVSFLFFVGLLLSGLSQMESKGSILTAAHDYFLVATSAIALLWCRRCAWYVVALCVLIVVVAVLVVEYRNGLTVDSLLYVEGPVWFLALIGVAYLQEGELRVHFITECRANATQKAAHTELELQKALLHMVVPSFATEAIAKLSLKRAFASFIFEVLRAEDELCVLLARLPSTPLDEAPLVFGHPAEALRAAERRFLLLDEALATATAASARERVAESKGAVNGMETTCFKIRAIGDEALVAGPISAIQAPIDPEWGVPALCTPAQTYAAAMVLVDVATTLLAATTCCTLVMCCSDGIIALMGDSPPIVDVVGPVIRTARAIMDAAPHCRGSQSRNVAYMNEGFVRVLSEFGTQLPQFCGNVHCPARQRWRLRAAGVQIVQSMMCCQQQLNKEQQAS